MPSKSKEIAKNTVLLYIRMIVVMIINLYTVRVVLRVLGVEDYGIFNVVAGVISMLNCVCTVLSTATQRYYSFALGKQKRGQLSSLFSVSTNIFLIFSLLVVLLGETVGLWFVSSQLVIPEGRHMAALWVYHFSILTFVVTLLQIPYSSAVLAHEDMGMYALLTTAEYVIKLVFVLLLPLFSYDQLILYGISLFVAQLLLYLAYWIYGAKQYEECHYKKTQERTLYKELLSFSGWTLFGSVAGVGMNQVNTILVNIFFGPIANAARGIALQINTAIIAFSNSFIMALRPPMIKSYAENDYSFLNTMFYFSNKFVYYFLLMICIPLFFEMESILKVWLNVCDHQTVLFSQLIVIYAIILALNNPISIIIQATGKVKEYNLAVETVTLICPLITYVLFKMGFPAYYTFIAMIACIAISHIIRMICLKKSYHQFSYREYVFRFMTPAFFITVIISLIAFYLHQSLGNELLRFIAILLFSILIISTLSAWWGLTREEKQMLKSLISKKS